MFSVFGFRFSVFGFLFSVFGFRFSVLFSVFGFIFGFRFYFRFSVLFSVFGFVFGFRFCFWFSVFGFRFRLLVFGFTSFNFFGGKPWVFLKTTKSTLAAWPAISRRISISRVWLTSAKENEASHTTPNFLREETQLVLF
jgi:hypothetical protein